MKKKKTMLIMAAVSLCALVLMITAGYVRTYAAQTYMLTYDYNAGSEVGTVPGSVKCMSGSNVNLGTDPLRSGYSFNGWNTAADGTGTSYNASDSITMTQDLTLYAQWTAYNYTVKFALAGGSPAGASLTGGADQTVSYSGTATGSCSVGGLGNAYQLTGWSYDYTAADGSAQKGFAPGDAGYTSVPVKGDVTFKAVIYKYIFVSAAADNGYVTIGGSTDSATYPTSAKTSTAGMDNIGSSGIPVSAAVRYAPVDENYQLDKVVVRDFESSPVSATLTDGNITFDGVNINLDKSGGTVTTDQSIRTSMEIHVYFKRISTNYTVKHYKQKADRSGYVQSDVQSIAADAGSTECLVPKFYDGYAYQAGQTRYSDSAHNTPQPDALTTEVNGTSVIELYYDILSYSLSFDMNGHGTAPEKQTVYFGAKAAAPSQPSQSGYTFVGWYDNSACTGTAVNFDSWTMPAGNTVLYAKWTENTVTYNYSSYDASMGSVSPAGETVAVYTGIPSGSEAAAKTGYRFVGWTDENNNQVSDDEAFVPAKSGGVYTGGSFRAVFEAKTCRVTFDTAGGQSVSGQNVTYGKAYGTLPLPVKSHCTFDGWFTESTGGTKVTADTIYNKDGDITLYAQWTKGTVSVDSISLDRTSLALLKGGQETLHASVTPADADNTSVTWSSSDTSVATVSEGKVTGVKAGTAVVTAKSVDGGHTASCDVTVTEAAPSPQPEPAVPVKSTDTKYTVMAPPALTYGTVIFYKDSRSVNAEYMRYKSDGSIFDQKCQLLDLSASDAAKLSAAGYSMAMDQDGRLVVTPGTGTLKSVSVKAIVSGNGWSDHAKVPVTIKYVNKAKAEKKRIVLGTKKIYFNTAVKDAVIPAFTTSIEADNGDAFADGDITVGAASAKTADTGIFEALTITKDFSSRQLEISIDRTKADALVSSKVKSGRIKLTYGKNSVIMTVNLISSADGAVKLTSRGSINLVERGSDYVLVIPKAAYGSSLTVSDASVGNTAAYTVSGKTQTAQILNASSAFTATAYDSGAFILSAKKGVSIKTFSRLYIPVTLEMTDGSAMNVAVPVKLVNRVSGVKASPTVLTFSQEDTASQNLVIMKTGSTKAQYGEIAGVMLESSADSRAVAVTGTYYSADLFSYADEGLTIKNAAALKKNRTYTLRFRVKFTDQAENAADTVVKLRIKVR